MKVRELIRAVMKVVLPMVPEGELIPTHFIGPWMQVEGVLTELPNFFCKVLEVEGRPWVVTPPGKDGKSWMFPVNPHGALEIRDRPVKKAFTKAEYTALPMRILAFVEVART